MRTKELGQNSNRGKYNNIYKLIYGKKQGCDVQQSAGRRKNLYSQEAFVLPRPILDCLSALPASPHELWGFPSALSAGGIFGAIASSTIGDVFGLTVCGCSSLPLWGPRDPSSYRYFLFLSSSLGVGDTKHRLCHSAHQILSSFPVLHTFRP